MEDYEIVCVCGSDTYKDYFYEGKFYGKVCQKCWKELLMSDIMVWEHSRPPTPRFLSRQMSLPEFKRAFPVSPARREIKEEEMISLMKGDHIMWRRPYVLWHHAIVITSVDPSDASNDRMLKVLHWSKTKKGIEVNEKSIVYSEELGTMYRACYDENVIRNNPPELVLARANALAGSTDYQFFKRNCENFAVFCKTGVNFNHQFPWLMLKLDETATGTLVRLFKMVNLIPLVSTIIFAEGIEFSWNFRQELIGACMVVLLELFSLVNDLGNMYFEYKYPASCYKVNREDYKTSSIMRFFEFMFGASGMVVGAITCEQLSIYIGKEICPGLGELIGQALALLFGTIGGFLLGTLCKALGNAFGICAARRSSCCYKSKTADAKSDHEPDDQLVPGPPGAESNCPMSLNDNQGENDDQNRKLQKIYRPSSWVAQLGLAVIIVNYILLFAFSKQYINVYKNFRNCVPSNCTTRQTTFLSNKTFPCVIIRVNVFDSPSNIVPIGSNSQLFEDENTFTKGNCSFYPYCLKNSTMSNKMVNKYVSKFGNEGANFSCYHQVNDPNKVIREYTPVKTFIHMFLWPTLFLCIGIFLIFYSVAKHKRDENCFSTIIIVLGLRSYFDLCERCSCCLRNSA